MLLKRNALLIDNKTKRYPVSVAEVQKLDSRYIFGEYVDENIIKELGFSPVEPTPRPTNGVYHEGEPTLVKGKFKQTWVAHVKTAQDQEVELQSLKQQKKKEAEADVKDALTKGYAYNFGTEKEPKIQHIQIREKDIPILVSLQQRAVSGEKDMVIRTAENENIVVAGEKVVTLVVEATRLYSKLMQSRWDIFAKIDAAKTAKDLPDSINV